MRLPQLVCIACLVLPAIDSGCRAPKRGIENIRRAQELLASKPAEAMQEYERAARAGADSIEVKKGLAAAHERLKEFDKARRLLREVIAQKPNDLDARLALAHVEVLEHHFDAARIELAATLGHQPPHVPSLLLFAALARNASHGKVGLDALGRLDKSHFAPLLKSAEYAFADASLKAAGGNIAGAEAVLAAAAKSKSINPLLALGLANASRVANHPRFAEWLLSRASLTGGAPEALHEALAEVALSQRHLSLAKAAISKLRTEFNPDPNALLLLAQLHDLRNDQAERAKTTRRALDAVPPQDHAGRRKVAMAHAIALERSGRVQEAETVLAGLLKRHPGFPPAQLLLAKLRLGQKRPDEAIQLGEILAKNEPMRTEAYQVLVAAHLLKNAPADAEAAARRYVESSSSSPDSVVLLANLLIRDKRLEAALREVEAGLARDPNQAELLAAQVTLTERIKGFEKAEAVAQAAARAKNPRILRELALFYERNNRLEQALNIRREIAAKEPKALLELSLLEDRMGRLPDAIGSIRKLTNADPYNTEALLRLSMLEERAGQVQVAKEVYERILNIDPYSVLALNNLSMLLAASSDPKRAVDLARRAYEVARDDPRVIDTLGWALVENKAPSDRGEAVGLLERSSAGLGTPEGYYHYGAALAAAGRFAEAKDALDRALAGRDSFAWRARATGLKEDVRRRLAEAKPSRP